MTKDTELWRNVEIALAKATFMGTDPQEPASHNFYLPPVVCSLSFFYDNKTNLTAIFNAETVVSEKHTESAGCFDYDF